jgi:hypothetical protein
VRSHGARVCVQHMTCSRGGDDALCDRAHGCDFVWMWTVLQFSYSVTLNQRNGFVGCPLWHCDSMHSTTCIRLAHVSCRHGTHNGMEYNIYYIIDTPV